MDSVLCCANAQSMKYYFNEEEYGILPDEVQAELKIALVNYCADVGGIIMLVFDDEHKLHIQVMNPIDEIGSELLVRRIQRGKAELFKQLEEFARAYGELKEKGMT